MDVVLDGQIIETVNDKVQEHLIKITCLLKQLDELEERQEW